MVRRALGLVPLEVAPVVLAVGPRLGARLVEHRTGPSGTDGPASLARLLYPGHTTSVPVDEKRWHVGIKELLGKGRKAAEDHADQIKAGIDKVEDLADKATKGKYSDKIEAAGNKLEKLVPDKNDEPGEPTQ